MSVASENQPIQATDWQLVGVTVAASGGVLLLFWLALRHAGRAAATR